LQDTAPAELNAVQADRLCEHWAFSVRRWAALSHIWVGAASVLYILVLCLSGCVVLFERDLYRLLSPDPMMEPTAAPRLSGRQLMNIALTRHPEHTVVGVWDKKVSADMIAEIWLDHQGELHRRLLDPYTGADLGPAQPASLRVLASVRQLHMNIASGTAGRVLNAFASVALVLLATSGLSSWILRKANTAKSDQPRNNVQSFHRRAGLWLVPFGALWGVTGLVLSIPSLFGDGTVEAAYALHAGVGGGSLTKILWAAAGSLISLLLLAGVWMCWHHATPNRLSCSKFQFFGPPSSSSAADIDFPPGRTITRAAATNGSDLAR
jgi:uncharacterized iron-regulated membrane protein